MTASIPMAPASVAPGGGASLAALVECSGLEFVARLAEGSVPRPPMAETLPFTLLPPEPGNVLLARPEPRFLNSTVHGGWIMTMLDTAMALAAQTTLSAGETCPSHETTAKFVRPILRDSGVLRVLGQVVSRSKTVITLEGRIGGRRGQATRSWFLDMPDRKEAKMISDDGTRRIGIKEPGGKAMSIISTMVGTMVLSRAVTNAQLSTPVLQSAAASVLPRSSASNARMMHSVDAASSPAGATFSQTLKPCSLTVSSAYRGTILHSRSSQPPPLQPGAHHHG
jgi:uncharacterized protein (TIGR00369 family)